MKNTKILIVAIALSLFSIQGYTQEIKVIKFPELEQILNKTYSKPVVINFWATWCAPCVKELPQFEALNKKYETSGLEVVLVSMDFVENLDSRVQKFATKKNLQSTLYLLDEVDYNSFIDKVDTSWSGAIPATIMIDGRTNKKTFFEKEFKEGELEKTYLEFIN